MIEIIYKDLALHVDGSYEPEEKQSLEHPPCTEEFIVESVILDGNDVTSIYASLNLLQQIGIEVLKQTAGAV